MKKLKTVLMLGLLVSLPLQQQAEAQEAKITVSKSKIGSGVAVFHDGNFRIAGSLAQPILQNPGQLTSGQLWYLPVQIITTEVVQKENSIPVKFSLDQNYPNPFNPEARFTLVLNQPQQVQIAVYDVLGREVIRLHEGRLSARQPHMFVLAGQRWASGLYLIRAVGETFSAVRRAVLVK